MAPRIKPRRAPQDWASTQRKETVTTVGEESERGQRGVNQMLDILLPQKAAAAASRRLNAVKGSKKSPPPPDAAEEVLEEYTTNVHSKHATVPHGDAHAGGLSVNRTNRSSEGTLTYFRSCC